METDIAVDLTGLTGSGRPGILLHRPAGIQVHHLGFAGSMGNDHIDYILADLTVIPEDDRTHYREKIAYLPDTYLPNDDKRAIPAPGATRAAVGLPESGFVFASFNNTYKFTPEMFDIWMRLLKAVEKSVLWLPATNDAAMRNLRREADARGVNPSRLIFASFVASADEHLARLKLAEMNAKIPGESLSVIVSTAVGRLPSVAPAVGFDSVRLTVSSGSNTESLTIGTLNVSEATPPPKTSVPDWLP